MKSRRWELAGELVLHRKEKPISLREISNSTKISMCYLEAIESGDFHKLPAGIYATSYLRQYASVIGFEEAELLDHYNAIVNPSAAPTTGQPEASPRGILERWLRVPAPLQRP
jgi:cytoskeletal protein RodZ